MKCRSLRLPLVGHRQSASVRQKPKPKAKTKNLLKRENHETLAASEGLPLVGPGGVWGTPQKGDSALVFPLPFRLILQ